MRKRILGLLLCAAMVLSFLPITNMDVKAATSPFIVTNGVLTDYTGPGGAVVIPEDLGITSIGNAAFDRRKYTLTSVIIPTNVTTISSMTFNDFKILTNITVNDSNTAYSSQDGILYNKDKTELITCPGGISGAVSIPSSVTKIGNHGFGDCTNLTDIAIPTGVNEIGAYAFSGCSGLLSIEIPNGLTSLGDGAFYGCSSLKSPLNLGSISSINYSTFFQCTSLESITVPSGVTTIEEYSFPYCENLKSITIPSSTTIIEDDAIYECRNLESINVDESNTVYSSLDGILYNEAKTDLLICPSGKVGYVTIPNGVINIESFSFCYGKVTGITIPSSVTNIPIHAFFCCWNLQNITVDDLNTTFSSQDGVVYNKDKTELILCPAGKIGSVIIPNGVKSINQFSFFDCRSVTDIKIPNGVTTIGEWAFFECSELTSLVIPSGVTSLGYSVIDNCLSLESITIPNTVTSIEDSFYYINDFLKIYCAKDSYAESYAINNGIDYVIVPTTFNDSTTNVQVNADTGVIPIGAQINVNKIESGAGFTLVDKSLDKVSDKFTLYDISFIKDNTTVQPNGKVIITLPIPDGYNKEKLTIYYVADDGTKQELTATIVGNTISFETTHFSYYVIAEKLSTAVVTASPKTSDNNLYLIFMIFMLVAVGGVLVTYRARKFS